MKTTIKTSDGSSIICQPSSDEIILIVRDKFGHVASAAMTPDQVGALMFGLEQASPETIAARIKRKFESECM